jgi:hypothetical protein
MDIPDTEIGYENFREENASELSDREHMEEWPGGVQPLYFRFK